MRDVLEIPEHLLPLQEHLLLQLEQASIRFEQELDSDLPPVAELCRHVERYRGKMLRPALVILSGLAARKEQSFETSEHHITLAAVCEMVHMATLVHDDVLDEAAIRRRGETVNALRGNEEAVILGDHLIASAYHLCSSLPTTAPARAIGLCSQVMCAGELLQLHNRNNWSLDEPTYIEILERKTGALIATSCELGAALSTDDSQIPAALRSFGLSLGVAFQIQDDLLDLTGDEAVVGKSVRKDLEKGKLTLPLIHHLDTANQHQRAATLSAIDRIATSQPIESDVAHIRDALDQTDSIAASQTAAATLVARAKKSLQILPEGAPRAMLDLMADAVIDRNY